ncbi:major facilitator superfamily domain-containing protein [Mycena belliarum]|uniref:Major facilitator superfamily domain-containing protein n=1 Tax=Mycena belliarum TaxID=1033014 RepID=A0AAD6TTN2_9AGAR|nr:major facilitator superfamily domain-containing protein [Mycena belliae]
MTDSIDEVMPLLPQPQRKGPTPLPKLQLAIVMLVQICEPLTSQSIYPFINQLVSELDITGGDEKKVGYYAGLIEALFFITESITVLQWSRASDYIGRKPVLTIGLLGSAISMLCFGLSRTFWALVVSRCLTGLLNGNSGVMKSTLADLLDSSNRAQGFAYIPLIWATGASLGPLIGGSLSRPQDRFPKTFTGRFWADFPYFLPCLVTAAFVFFSFLVVLLLFKETVPQRTKKDDTRLEGHDAENGENSQSAKPRAPLPLRELFTFPIIISVSNYFALAFLNIALAALLPLFLAMPLEIGGLGLPPFTIGVILAVYGCTTGLFQVSFFSRLVRRFGERRVFIFGLSTCLPIFAILPLISLVAQKSGLTFGIWILVGCVLVLGAMMDSSFGAIFMFIVASAPKSSRGTVNGLSQTTASISRAIGPVLSTSLFSLSVEWNILGGYAVYAFFFILSALALLLARRLPERVWDEED